MYRRRRANVEEPIASYDDDGSAYCVGYAPRSLRWL